MNKARRIAVALAIAIPVHVAKAAPDLHGSEASMAHQHAVAVEESYSFLRTAADVRHFAEEGRLVPVDASDDFTLSGVSFAFARPEVRSFLERFAKAYHDATGARLVVTSLTRPEANQPKNAHKLSVHPAGMAVDFRVPGTAAERAYLERALLALEKQGLLDVTRERTPAHYHVAVFPEVYRPYAAHLDSIAAAGAARRTEDRLAARRLASTLTARATRGDEGGSPLGGLLLGVAALATISVPAVRRVRQQRRKDDSRD